MLFLAFTSCYSQNNTKLTFVNRSSSPIDSIVISAQRNINLGQIDIGKSKSQAISDIKIDTHREGVFSFTAFLNNKRFNRTWGFFDFGKLQSKEEVFYIFDNGINYLDKPLVKPLEFKLYYYNASPKNIDTILSENHAIIKVNETTPRNIEIVYDYTKIQESKEFAVVMSGRKIYHNLEFHDFSNWNNNQAFLYFENESIHEGTLELKEPFEFIIDLQIGIPLPTDSITCASNAIIKTYRYEQPRYIQLVFDFKKLKSNPICMIKAGGKTYTLNLSSHDFSNIYATQRIFYLEKTGIRSLSE